LIDLTSISSPWFLLTSIAGNSIELAQQLAPLLTPLLTPIILTGLSTILRTLRFTAWKSQALLIIILGAKQMRPTWSPKRDPEAGEVYAPKYF
jgi:hypothetical protein